MSYRVNIGKNFNRYKKTYKNAFSNSWDSFDIYHKNQFSYEMRFNLNSQKVCISNEL